MQQTAVIILAAGSGQRMATISEDKLLLSLHGQPAWLYGWEAFESIGIADSYWVVYRDSAQRRELQASLSTLTVAKAIHWVAGGAERMDSVYAALKVIPDSFAYVFIHDAARPLVSPQALHLLKTSVQKNAAAVLAHRPKDTLKRVAVDAVMNKSVRLEDLERSRLWAVETPQVFERRLIVEAYGHVMKNGLKITDDTAAVEAIGKPVAIVENPHPNPKLTTPEDIPFLSALISNKKCLED
jgi:2-C-methyl-D-erythritol 4-phosphate cytidylyltransferase